MKNFSHVLLGCCFVATLACESPPPDDSLTEKLADTMDPALELPALEVVAPEFVATLEKNDHVAVALIDLTPGARIPEHDAVRRAVYALSDCSLWTTIDGDAQMLTYSAGDADTWAAGRYELENASDEEAELIVVSRFDTALPGDSAAAITESSTEDVPTSPEPVAFDPYFETVNIAVEPDESLSLHCEHPCVIYTVTPATIGVSDGAEVVDRNEYFSSRATWFDRGSDLVVEAEDEPVRLVVFEIKK